ncbi:MAG: hypothetical protein JNM43_21900 [Planctomycetaceae bacterium]|nr:hypothetical protein [Planctomycetaceae bacterium]
MSSPLNQIQVSACNSTPGTVPVFNCLVILRTSDDGRKLHGRVANLAGMTAESWSERELLMQLTRRFKDHLQTSLKNEQPVAWIDPPEEPQAGEQLRYIPVHL